jgi:hypothetical protein
MTLHLILLDFNSLMIFFEELKIIKLLVIQFCVSSCYSSLFTPNIFLAT